ncbi:hypothetical protein ACFL1N_16725 [Thermodesulfobacteriota bacterium]
MKETQVKDKGPGAQITRRTIRHSLKVIFFCMTALPFFVFVFVYFQIGAIKTVLSGALIALALILVLEGFIVFRRMADHIERLSVTMAEAGDGKIKRIDDAGDTKAFKLDCCTDSRSYGFQE